jgi:NADH-quinone oxidoreductase subunit G
VPIRNDAGLVQIGNRRDLVLPANDTLFTSGSLGRYCASLTDLQAKRDPAAASANRPDGG